MLDGNRRGPSRRSLIVRRVADGVHGRATRRGTHHEIEVMRNYTA
jgi:hypothetical protein